MSNNPNQLVQTLWNCCNPAVAGRDDGLSYGDYVEHPTFLLFLKMVAKAGSAVTEAHDWTEPALRGARMISGNR